MSIIRVRKNTIEDLDPPRLCYVYGCESANGEIFCGVKKQGVAVRQDKNNYYVLVDGALLPYDKSEVIFEK